MLRTYDERRDDRKAVCAVSSSVMIGQPRTRVRKTEKHTSKQLNPRRFRTLTLHDPVHKVLSAIDVRVVLIAITSDRFPSSLYVVEPSVVSRSLNNTNTDLLVHEHLYALRANQLTSIRSSTRLCHALTPLGPPRTPPPAALVPFP